MSLTMIGEAFNSHILCSCFLLNNVDDVAVAKLHQKPPGVSCIPPPSLPLPSGVTLKPSLEMAGFLNIF